jgi:hypothetical protein
MQWGRSEPLGGVKYFVIYQMAEEVTRDMFLPSYYTWIGEAVSVTPV